MPPAFDAMRDKDFDPPPVKRTYVGVIALEAAIIVVLWLIGWFYS